MERLKLKNASKSGEVSYHTPHKAAIKHHPKDGRAEHTEIFIDGLKLRCVLDYGLRNDDSVIGQYVLNLCLLVEMDGSET